jgi:molecular chaperone Hsp33
MPHDDDQLHRFLLEHAGVRGVLVRLTEAWHEVANRAEYPPPLRELLGQALAASALLSGNVSFRGSLSLQLKAAGPVKMLFAQCERDQVRGLAQWSGDIPQPLQLDQLRQPLLVVTLEHEDGRRQQGLIPVESGSFAALVEHYFDRSEQLPTRIVMAVSEQRCAALLLQRVATGGGHSADPDAWNRVLHLTATLRDDELLNLPAETLLALLYHDENVRLLETHALRFGCRCSRERVGAVLVSLGRVEAQAAVQADGRVEVTCEFCNRRYHFDRVDLELLFRDGGSAAPAARTTH